MTVSVIGWLPVPDCCASTLAAFELVADRARAMARAETTALATVVVKARAMFRAARLGVCTAVAVTALEAARVSARVCEAVVERVRKYPCPFTRVGVCVDVADFAEAASVRTCAPD